MVPIPILPDPISYAYEFTVTPKTHLFAEFFTKEVILGCDLVCDYKSDDCSNSLPVLPGYQVQVSLTVPLAILAPINVIEGYLNNAICLHCTSNNLVDGTL